MKGIQYALMLCVAILSAGCDKDEEAFFEDSTVCVVLMDGDCVQTDLDALPAYLNGGEDGFNMALMETVLYPPYAREHGIQGWCRVRYEISEMGEVDNILILEDPGGGIGEATVKALMDATPGIAFSPGILNGSPVRVRKELRMLYKLQ
jgi:hypothetical protein